MTDNGGYTFNPAENWNGTVSFSYTVTDPAESSVEVVRTIRVLAVNDAPQGPLYWHLRSARLIFLEVSSSTVSPMESENSELTINNLAVSAGFISGNDSDRWTYYDDFNGETQCRFRDVMDSASPLLPLMMRLRALVSS